MQTFLPYPDFEKSLQCLDYRRLGKQRVESYQIINTLEGRSEGWKNHPAVKMWKGYVEALKHYYNLNLQVWEEHGYKNIKLQPFYVLLYSLPEWFGDDRLHASHRSNLIKKDNKWYSQFGWTETDLPYWWPK